MSVRVDGNLEFQMWYYENYGDVAGIVSDEIYSEYRDWKREHPSFFTRLIEFILRSKKKRTISGDGF